MSRVPDRIDPRLTAELTEHVLAAVCRAEDRVYVAVRAASRPHASVTCGATNQCGGWCSMK